MVIHVAEGYTNKGKYVLVERYIKGTEFTIDGIVLNGCHHSLAISEKSHFTYKSEHCIKIVFFI